MKKTYFLILFCFITTFQSCMKEPDIQPNTPHGNFKALWDIIDKRYCYLDYKKIDWDSVYTVYSPRVDTVKSVYSFFDLMDEMLATLKDGHVNLTASFDISRYWNWFTDYPANFNSTVISKSRYLGSNYRIAGSIRYNKIASGKVGYMYYGSFSDGFSAENIKKIFESFVGCEGLIIDIRNNGGGMLTYAEQLSSYFFKEKTLTGHISHKTGDGHSDFSKPIAFYTEPANQLFWGKPVVVLTNRMVYSAANDFVCRMKYARNATIIGDQTGGGGGLPLSSELPNGWMIRFSSCPMYNAKMENTEWGIQPDIKVDMNSSDESKEYDTIIETAIRNILK